MFTHMAYNNIFFDLVNCLEIIHSYYISLYTMFSKHFLRLIPEGIVYQLYCWRPFFRNSNFYRSILDALSICSRFPVKRS